MRALPTLKCSADLARKLGAVPLSAGVKLPAIFVNSPEGEFFTWPIVSEGAAAEPRKPSATGRRA